MANLTAMRRLKKVVDKSIQMYDNLDPKYQKDTATFNSRTMLQEILDHITDVPYLTRKWQCMDVGLLAARGLDWVDKTTDPEHYKYAESLHQIMGEYFALTGQCPWAP